MVLVRVCTFWLHYSGAGPGVFAVEFWLCAKLYLLSVPGLTVMWFPNIHNIGSTAICTTCLCKLYILGCVVVLLEYICLTLLLSIQLHPSSLTSVATYVLRQLGVMSCVAIPFHSMYAPTFALHISRVGLRTEGKSLHPGIVQCCNGNVYNFYSILTWKIKKQQVAHSVILESSFISQMNVWEPFKNLKTRCLRCNLFYHP